VAASKETLTRIIEMQPGTESAAQAHFELGVLQLDGADLEAAMTSLRQVPPHWPRWHGRAGLAIARIYEARIRDIGAAEREYRKVIRRHPDSFAAAECHARLADLTEAMGDPLSAENLRECAMRTYQRVIETTDNEPEREEALRRFVAASRRLERWEPALEALTRQRREAIKRRDTPRRMEIDREIGDVYVQREQHGNALLRYRECLLHARRSGPVADVVELTASMVRCLEFGEDAAAARKAWESLLDYVKKDAARLTAIAKDFRLAAIVIGAYVATGRMTDARRLRARLGKIVTPDTRSILEEIDARIGAVIDSP
jgi:tetratricopeptide (TPR) repeat protein